MGVALAKGNDATEARQKAMEAALKVKIISKLANHQVQHSLEE